MENPWLNVPLPDYEGHMNAPAVGQLIELADLFGVALSYCRPASVAILGIAGGNGLDRVDAGVTQRVVGIDIHPTYLEAVRSRYPGLPLTLLCADLGAEAIDVAPVEMVHAALIFEHAGIDQCLVNAVSLVSASGALSVVLQLPSDVQAGVAPTAFASMQRLKAHFSLIDPRLFSEALRSQGFALVHEQRRELPGGKAFWLGIFKRSV